MTKEEMAAESASAHIDPFFAEIPDSQWNACIGSQGDAENYVDGYIEAAQVLIEAVIGGRMMSSRDTLIMPVLYNCRHALELSLKYTVDRLSGAKVDTGPYVVNHDIQAHWRLLRDSKIGDEMLRGLLDSLEPFIDSLAKIDTDGQQLRYAKDRDGKKSLSDFALINLRLVRYSVGRLGRILGVLKARVHEIVEERLTGTYTKECSRADLEAIAKLLGDRSQWADPTFDETKAEICKRFGLSGRKFSEAVNAIDRSRPLKVQTGRETALLHVSDEKLLSVLCLWADANPVRIAEEEDLGLDLYSCDFDKMIEHAKQSLELTKAVSLLLSREELADIEALFYIGRDRLYGECYERRVATALESLGVSPSLDEGIRHLMSKMNLLDGISAGLRAVGKPCLSQRVNQMRQAREVAGQPT